MIYRDESMGTLSSLNWGIGDKRVDSGTIGIYAGTIIPRLP